MDRLYKFWTRYCTGITDAARSFVHQQHVLHNYAQGKCIKLPDEHFPYYCVVLDGIVGGYQTNHGGHPVLRDLVLPLDFFTGTEHTFTRRTKNMEYRALARTTLMVLPIAVASEGQLLHPQLAELFHVMKQRKIDQLRKLVAIYQETDYYARYCIYRGAMPDFAWVLPNTIQRELLGMSETTYYRVKRKFLKSPTG